jgi:hypothetical protein
VKYLLLLYFENEKKKRIPRITDIQNCTTIGSFDLITIELLKLDFVLSRPIKTPIQGDIQFSQTNIFWKSNIYVKSIFDIQFSKCEISKKEKCYNK